MVSVRSIVYSELYGLCTVKCSSENVFCVLLRLHMSCEEFLSPLLYIVGGSVSDIRLCVAVKVNNYP
jgi:hypothetical protein